MSPGSTSRPYADDSSELARLRRELAEAHARLEEETAYYRAELEASRQRLERDSTRLQADEVARRRRAEQELAALQAALQETEEKLLWASRRNEELAQELAALQANVQQRERQAADQARAAGRDAWREAERELARLEQELEAARRALDEERRRGAATAQRQDEVARARAGEQEALRLVASLKKALWATAEARRRAEAELALLREQAAGHDSPGSQPVAAPAAGLAARSADEVHEVSEETLKSVFFGDLSADFTDEFLLTPSDASLDLETVDRLRSVVATTAAPASPPRGEPPARPLAAERPPTATQRLRVPAAPAEPAPRRRRGGIVWVLVLTALVGVVAWLVVSGRLDAAQALVRAWAG